MHELEPSALADFRAATPDAVLLDVREPFEYDLVHLDGAVLVPMTRLPAGIEKAIPDRTRPIIIYCHHGIRSVHAAAFLEHLGYEAVHNLTGGIDRLSIEVDPDVPRY